MNLDEYLKNNPKKFLIFDLDETILKLRLPWKTYIDGIRDKLNKVDSTILDRYKVRSISPSELQNEYVKKNKDMIEFIKTYNETFESQLKDYDPNRTIIDFIKNNLDHTMYLWSSNCERTVKSVLTKEGILDKFKVLITRTNVDFIKPNPEGFLYIYEEGTDLNDYLFVGDNIADRRAANSIGIDFFEVNYFKLIA